MAKKCTFKGCDRDHYAKGYCNTHWQQWRKGGPMREIRQQNLTKVRDDRGRKKCRGCSQWLSPKYFYNHSGTADRLTPECRECLCVRQAESRFNLSPGTYRQLLQTQDGGCAICGQRNPAGQALAIDRNHACCPGKGSCGKCVRSLLCSRCNSGLGLFQDNPDTLRAAAAYLVGHRERLGV